MLIRRTAEAEHHDIAPSLPLRPRATNLQSHMAIGSAVGPSPMDDALMMSALRFVEGAQECIPRVFSGCGTVARSETLTDSQLGPWAES